MLARSSRLSRRCRGRGQLRLLLHERNSQAGALLQLAVIEVRKPCNDTQQGGFARAVAADQAQPLAAFHGELRAIQKRAVAEGEVSIEKCDECHDDDCPDWTAEGKHCRVATLNQVRGQHLFRSQSVPSGVLRFTRQPLPRL